MMKEKTSRVALGKPFALTEALHLHQKNRGVLVDFDSFEP